MILRSMAIYGTATDRRTIAVWHANPDYIKWEVRESVNGADHQRAFEECTALPGYRLAGCRPRCVTLSSDQRCGALFTDDVVGEWVARHGLAGRHPIDMRGGGIGNATRYAAMFAAEVLPRQRRWSFKAPQSHPLNSTPRAREPCWAGPAPPRCLPRVRPLRPFAPISTKRACSAPSALPSTTTKTR
jgi:hypothetical protein